jgi:type IV pilus assembly protein PilV
MGDLKIPRYSIAKFQRGIMLLEGLIAILIFSLGILAVVGMQATTINHSSQAKYRTDAAFVANKLIGQMWADSKGARTDYATGGAKFNQWVTQEVEAYLPKGRTTATVTVTSFIASGFNLAGAPVGTGHSITIEIRWRAPNEDITVPAHTYVTTTEIVS